MHIYKAYQFRMYPNKEQQEKINQMLGSSRFIYNYYLGKRQKTYQETSKTWSLSDMKKDLVSLQRKYPWLKEVDSCLLRTSLDNLDTSYQRFFKEDVGFPKFKKKGKREHYRTVNNRSSYKGKEYASIQVDLEKEMIKLPKLGKIDIRGYRTLKEFPYKVLNATIRKVAGKYYVSVCIEEEIQEIPFTFKNSIGLDLGVKNTICCSDGLKYQMTKKIERQERRLKGLQKALSRSQKGSQNRRKLILKIQRVYQRIKNMRKYFIHEITTKIVRENDIIVCETLDVKEMIEKKKYHLAKFISNASFSEIIRQLKYKSEWSNKKFYQVPKYYPSSQLCNHCGIRNQEVKNLNIREWECKNCGRRNERDINASLNIEERGIMMYFEELYGTN